MGQRPIIAVKPNRAWGAALFHEKADAIFCEDWSSAAERLLEHPAAALLCPVGVVPDLSEGVLSDDHAVFLMYGPVRVSNLGLPASQVAAVVPEEASVGMARMVMGAVDPITIPDGAPSALTGASLLGGDTWEEVQSLVINLRAAMGATACLFWSQDGDSPQVLLAGPVGARKEELLAASRAALQHGAPVCCQLPVGEGGADQLVTMLAGSLGSGGSGAGSGVSLIFDGARAVDQTARALFSALCRRLAGELAWLSAHNRLVLDHERLRDSALFDPLVRVMTRRALEQVMGQREAGEHAVAIVDYQMLHAVNEEHGHEVGDAALVHFAEIVRAFVGPDDMVGRFAGDELAVFLRGASVREAVARMEVVSEALADHPFVDEGVEFTIAATIGVAPVAEGQAGVELALGHAQMAMRSARRDRNTIATYDPSVARGPATKEPVAVAPTLGGMYRILHHISRGAMGTVYRGEDLGLGRPVAIKVLRSELALDHDLVERFRAEAKILASLRHPNLVQVYSFGTEGSDVYFVMELVEGMPVSELIARTETWVDSEIVASITEEVAEALDEVHAAGIIHRDVKPANVVLDRTKGRAVLVDVGVAQRPGDDEFVAGTPGYSAPESFTTGLVNPSTDVYGLAATVYAMLTGSDPFQGQDTAQTITMQSEGPPPTVSEVRPDLSLSVDHVLAKALDPEPANRYESAMAFAIALDKALSKGPNDAITPQPRVNKVAATAATEIGDTDSEYALTRHPPALDSDTILEPSATDTPPEKR